MSREQPAAAGGGGGGGGGGVLEQAAGALREDGRRREEEARRLAGDVEAAEAAAGRTGPGGGGMQEPRGEREPPAGGDGRAEGGVEDAATGRDGEGEGQAPPDLTAASDVAAKESREEEAEEEEEEEEEEEKGKEGEKEKRKSVIVVGGEAGSDDGNGWRAKLLSEKAKTEKLLHDLHIEVKEPTNETERHTHDERMAVIQASACAKLQSLWKGHKARSKFAPQKPKYQVVELNGITIEGIGNAMIRHMRTTFIGLRVVIGVWNLQTSFRVFRWQSEIVRVKDIVNVKEFVEGAIDTQDGAGVLTSSPHRVMLPGIDDNCVLNISLYGERGKKGPPRLLFETTLVDLELFGDAFLLASRKDVSVSAQAKHTLQKNELTESAYQDVKFSFRVQSVTHSFCGWLWVSSGPESAKESSPLSPGSPKSPVLEDLVPIRSPRPIWTRVASLFFPLGGKKHEPRSPGPETSQSSAARDSGSQVNVEHIDNHKEKQAWVWARFWAVCFAADLVLFEDYGSLERFATITSDGRSLHATFLFSESETCTEFTIKRTTPKSPVLQGFKAKGSFGEVSTLHFLADSRAQAISWVTKLKASAL